MVQDYVILAYCEYLVCLVGASSDMRAATKQVVHKCAAVKWWVFLALSPHIYMTSLAKHMPAQPPSPERFVQHGTSVVLCPMHLAIELFTNTSCGCCGCD